MKKLLPTCILSAASLLAPLGIFAAEATTDPVGGMTVTITGNGGSGTAFTSLSVPLAGSIEARGAATSVSASAITNTNASYTASAYASTDAGGSPAYYVEILSGANEGLLLDVTANTATTLTLDTGGIDLSTLISAGTTYCVKKYKTLADIFGAANEIGLTSGGSTTSSDIIWVMANDGSGGFEQFYYQDDPLDGVFGGDGWRKAGASSTDVATTRVAPDQGLLIQRRSSGDVSNVVTGTVKASDAIVPLSSGFNMVSWSFPTDTTLGASGLYTDGSQGLQAGGSATSADIVYIMDSAGNYTQYYYQDDPLDGVFGGDGWRQAGDNSTDASGTTIPAGSSMIIQTRGSAISWKVAMPYTL